MDSIPKLKENANYEEWRNAMRGILMRWTVVSSTCLKKSRDLLLLLKKEFQLQNQKKALSLNS